MNERLLMELMEAYKALYNLEMANNDEPVNVVDVEFLMEPIPVPGRADAPDVNMLSIRTVANGLTMNELSRVIGPEDDIEAVREELCLEMIVSVFSLGMHIFKMRKMRELLQASKN